MLLISAVYAPERLPGTLRVMIVGERWSEQVTVSSDCSRCLKRTLTKKPVTKPSYQAVEAGEVEDQEGEEVGTFPFALPSSHRPAEALKQRFFFETWASQTQVCPCEKLPSVDVLELELRTL
mmetsp:Transcript_37090/g.116692  ORF Transcript_37090/g.116692 Transcript_37090/m.116692 type:complete len:122 (-) Transcript_37090:1030-1395(-)